LRQLLAVQRRRALPTKVTQGFQLQVQNRILAPSFQRQATPTPPLFLRILNRWPGLRRFNARMIGMGIRPEHIQTRATLAANDAASVAPSVEVVQRSDDISRV